MKCQQKENLKVQNQYFNQKFHFSKISPIASVCLPPWMAGVAIYYKTSNILKSVKPWITQQVNWLRQMINSLFAAIFSNCQVSH